jgi:DnaJ family protein C protein 8
MADSEPKQEEYSWSRGKDTSTSTKAEPTKSLDKLTKEAKATDVDFNDFLAKEEKEANKDDEIDRIRKAFRRNAYDVLDLQPGVPDEDIKKVYRKKSILVHPDKSSNPYAQDAFDRLAKAYQTLLDEKERALLDEAISDARMLLIRERKLTVDSEEVKDPDEDFMKAWKGKVYEVIRDNEMRRERQRRAQMQDEGRQQRKEEEELAERKRKREHEQVWEKTREQRVGSWRDFQKKATGEEGKKGKKKLKVLG